MMLEVQSVSICAVSLTALCVYSLLLVLCSDTDPLYRASFHLLDDTKSTRFIRVGRRAFRLGGEYSQLDAFYRGNQDAKFKFQPDAIPNEVRRDLRIILPRSKQEISHSTDSDGNIIPASSYPQLGQHVAMDTTHPPSPSSSSSSSDDDLNIRVDPHILPNALQADKYFPGGIEIILSGRDYTLPSSLQSTTTSSTSSSPSGVEVEFRTRLCSIQHDQPKDDMWVSTFHLYDILCTSLVGTTLEEYRQQQLQLYSHHPHRGEYPIAKIKDIKIKQILDRKYANREIQISIPELIVYPDECHHLCFCPLNSPSAMMQCKVADSTVRLLPASLTNHSRLPSYEFRFHDTHHFLATAALDDAAQPDRAEPDYIGYQLQVSIILDEEPNQPIVIGDSIMAKEDSSEKRCYRFIFDGVMLNLPPGVLSRAHPERVATIEFKVADSRSQWPLEGFQQIQERIIIKPSQRPQSIRITYSTCGNLASVPPLFRGDRATLTGTVGENLSVEYEIMNEVGNIITEAESRRYWKESRIRIENASGASVEGTFSARQRESKSSS